MGLAVAKRRDAQSPAQGAEQVDPIVETFPTGHAKGLPLGFQSEGTKFSQQQLDRSAIRR
jgi:hypothetical protein